MSDPLDTPAMFIRLNQIENAVHALTMDLDESTRNTIRKYATELRDLATQYGVENGRRAEAVRKPNLGFLQSALEIALGASEARNYGAAEQAIRDALTKLKSGRSTATRRKIAR